MKITRLFALLLSCSICVALHAVPRPNVIFILTDDLGFGDTGPSFQNQRAAQNDRRHPAFSTPQLDALATDGLQLRNHYCAAPVCAPSRASLLRGVHQGHAEVRNNQFDKGLNDRLTIGTVLRQAGYATAAIGKWGLQGRPDNKPPGEGTGAFESAEGTPSLWPSYPTKRGFDFYFGYVRHRDGHAHYPKEDRKQIWENESEISADLALCYTTDLFTARAKVWIAEQHAARSEQPFFLFLAYDTPHAKLQNPPCAYPDGGGLKGGVQWTGHPGAMLNTAIGTVDGWMDPALANATWDHDADPATAEMPWPDVQKRYANGVRRIDAAVGDIVQLLKDLRIDRETLIVFTSDNGPALESYLPETYAPDFFKGFGPFDGVKRDLWEGGIRVPTFVRWPAHIPGGRESNSPSGQWDWMSTLAELAGVPAPAASDGVSLVPTLTGAGRQRPSTLYFEYQQQGSTPDLADFAPSHRNRQRNQMQAVHVDGYKGIRYNIDSASDDFEIYDLRQDPGETTNLAADPAFAALQAKMQARVLQVRRAAQGAARPYDGAAVPAVSPDQVGEPGLLCTSYEGEWPWLPEFRELTPVASSHVDRIDLTPRPRDEKFGLAFSGLFHAAVEGDYTFEVASNGGAALFFHGIRVIDEDLARDGAAVRGTIRLAAGWHPLRFYYRHAHGERRLEITYRGPAESSEQPLDARVLATSKHPIPEYAADAP